ncbi:MAG TPA: asparagine synthase (glutamine-hydrolyzing) [Desulfobacteria bacterium]|nr:asparagine synthase (glutamine-hydrolyzing) [Desulfobacteria bacterium]
MCGITGWVDWERDLRQNGRVIEQMNRKLTPRGPDADGIWLSEHAAFGHRRLIVIDPAGGIQPMVRVRNEQTYILVYNGELYNTNEIRQELLTLGYVFQGHSDTEVVLNAYIAWGDTCVQRFNGIFAFAVWDEAAQRLFLARDRMGVKPLFYWHNQNTFLFASELKGLVAHPLVEPIIDAEGLAEIFVMGPSRTPGHGVFKHVKELRPGYYLNFSHTGLSVKRYWAPRSAPHEDDLDTTVSKVRSLVLDSIRRQLVSDVPVCTFLSGGLDSSAITAIAADHYRRNNLGALSSFSVDYVDNDKFFTPSAFQPNQDAPWANLVSRSCGTVHHTVKVDTPQLVDALTDAVVARDLPGMADVDSSLLLFCREIKKHATVALSGECADEVFGGYPWFRSEEAINSGTFPWSRKINEKLALFSPELLEMIKPTEYLSARYADTLAEVPVHPDDSAADRKMREMFYLNLTWFMTTLLDRKDRMSMATGLEVRVPFCDHRLVEYVWNIPWRMKYCDQQEKGILRRALTGFLPPEVLKRRKSPYPKTHNPAYTDAVTNVLSEILRDTASPLLQFVNRTAVGKLVAAKGANFDIPWFGQLMTGPQLFAYLIQVNDWFKEYNVKVV